MTVDWLDSALSYWPDPNETRAVDALPWEDWVQQITPEQTKHEHGNFHRDFWKWVYTIRLGEAPTPTGALLIWPRGWGKSQSAEIAVANLGARNRRRYCLYVCATQTDADKHVSSVASILESPEMAAHYPSMGARLLNKFGQSKGWRRDRLRTSTGFTVDGVGLTSEGIRGLRTEAQRPDLIVFDDIDQANHGNSVIRKLEREITHTVMLAGSNDAAVIFAQNLIHAGSIVNRLYTREADWLADRWTSGPFAAVDGLEYESAGMDEHGAIKWRITGGKPNWAGMDLAECERHMNAAGPEAFVAESQNDVTTRKGALWTPDSIPHVPPGFERGHAGGLIRTVVGVDPSVSDSPTADECGIVVAAKGADGRGYVLADRSIRAHPDTWARRVVAAAREFNAVVVAEQNQGYEMVRSVIHHVDPLVQVQLVNAGGPKRLRAQPISAVYAEGFVSHVGRHPDLETQMCSWLPEDGDSPDRLDALVYALATLFPGTGVVQQSRMAEGRTRR